jgi:hypothetical protein
MARGNVIRVGVFLCGAFAFLSCSLGAGREQSAVQNPAPTVVRMEKTPHGIAYQVDSTPTGHTATTDILRALNLVEEKLGPNAPVVVLADSRVSFTDVWNFEGVAEKAQLNSIRVFVFNHQTNRMAELKWGPTVPLSTNPN